jgi:hypothetical protein
VVIGVAIVAALLWLIGNWFRGHWQSRSRGQQKLAQTGPNEDELKLPADVVVQRASDEVQLIARNAMIHGASATIVEEGETGVIADWSASEEYLSWRFFLRKGGVFRIQVTYALDGEPGLARWRVVCNDQQRSFDLRASGGLESFVTDDQGLLQIQDPGMHTLELHVTDKPEKLRLNVKSVVLVPRRR